MRKPTDLALERIKVREAAGVFHTRDSLEAAIDALLRSGFDRADIDIMAGVDAVQQKLGAVYAAAEKSPDLPSAPRHAYIARKETTTPLALTAGILTYIGATAAAAGVVASGGSLAVALVAAAAGGAAGAGLGVRIAHKLGLGAAQELEERMERGGLVLWVRVRSPQHETKAQEILRQHGGEAVRVHEIEIEKRLEDIPLSSLRPDPWLGSEPLGHPS
jgi:hypothetical protein